MCLFIVTIARISFFECPLDVIGDVDGPQGLVTDGQNWRIVDGRWNHWLRLQENEQEKCSSTEHVEMERKIVLAIFGESPWYFESGNGNQG